jgi:hypothetical protein
VGRHVHRARRKHRVHPDARGDRVLHRLVHDGNFRDADRGAAAVVGRCLCGFPAVEPAWRRTLVPRLRDRHARRACRACDLLVQRTAALRLQPLGTQHWRWPRRRARRIARRRRLLVAVRHWRRTRFAAIRGLALSRDRAVATCGGGVIRPEGRHAEGPDLRHDDADDLGVADHVPELECRVDRPRQDARCLLAGNFGRTAARRIPRDGARARPRCSRSSR